MPHARLVHAYVGNLNKNNYPNNLLAVSRVGGMVLAGELVSNKPNDIKVYFKLREATFEMNNYEFITIMKLLRDVKTRWLSVEEARS